MKQDKLPKRIISFCSACILFLGSLYLFVNTAYEQADALVSRPVPLELRDLIKE
jgi:hypothetical protein